MFSFKLGISGVKETSWHESSISLNFLRHEGNAFVVKHCEEMLVHSEIPVSLCEYNKVSYFENVGDKHPSFMSNACPLLCPLIQKEVKGPATFKEL